jgi:hypothetical protein
MALKKLPLVVAATVFASSTTLAFGEQLASLANFKTKYEDGRFAYVVDITNSGTERLKGAMCIQLLDKDGFLVERMAPPLVNMGVGDTQQDTYSMSYDKATIDDVTQVKAYFGEWACITPEGDALSDTLTLPYP